ncbi:hypothetical protein [Pedococcus sp. P5_B7]
MTEGSGSSAHVTQDWRLTGVPVVDTRIDLCASSTTSSRRRTTSTDSTTGASVGARDRR